MNLRHKFHRLKIVSPHLIPRLVSSKVASKLISCIERFSYKPQPLNSNSSDKIQWGPRPIGLIHNDVLTPGFSDLFIEDFPQDAENIIKEADAYIELKFDLLDSALVDLKKFRDRSDLKMINSRGGLVEGRVTGRIPWHFDFKSGVGWDPQTFYTDMLIGRHPGVDVKVPWELSRCHHLVRLGEAYRLSHEEKYAQAFVNHIEDWIQQNPVKYGVNWASPMDTAIRAINWIIAWELFQDSSKISKEFLSNFQNSLLEQGLHIRRHLEYGGNVSTNHYLANLMGLFFLGLALGRDDWKNKAQKELDQEIISQTTSDGMDYEASTSYHGMVTEFFLLYHLAKSRGRKNDDAKDKGSLAVDRLKKMIHFLNLTTSADGETLQIGDNDNGHLLSFLKRQDRDFRWISQAGAQFFKSSNLKIDSWPVGSETVWLFGFGGAESFKSLPGVKLEDLKQDPKPASGLVIWKTEKYLLSFSVQPNGTNGVGNHTHNDKLSFTLAIQGENYLVDPGTGVYSSDPKVRNILRSTSSHNTMQVSGLEQNEFVPGSIFSLEDNARLKILDHTPGQFIKAVHTGYKRLKSPVVHQRSIMRKAQLMEWEIQDELLGKGERTLTSSMVLAPHLKAELITPFSVLVKGDQGNLTMEFLGPDNFQIKLIKTPYSARYGNMSETMKIQINGTVELPVKLSCRLKWEPKQGE